MRDSFGTPARKAKSVELGRLGEDFAALFAQMHGMTVIDRNVRVGQKEIDLLLLDGDCLVFAEVRLRRSNRCGSAAESVTRRKVGLLRAAMRGEIRKRAWRGAYRLDLMTLDFAADASGLVLEHYRGL